MLTRIFLDNFRAFVNFEFRPERMTLLLGDNGTGKTSLFDALAILTDVIVRGARVGELLWGTRTIWDRRDVQRFELDVQGPAGFYRYTLEVVHPGDSTKTPSIRSETVTLDGKYLHRYSDGQVQVFKDDDLAGPQFPFGSEQSILGNLGPAGSKLGWFKQFVAGIRLLQLNPFIESVEGVSKQGNRYLARNGANFPSFFQYINDELPDARAALETELRRVFPGFRNMFFRQVGPVEKVLFFDFGADAAGKREFTIRHLSEGQRTLAMLYSVLFGLVGNSTMVGFDEPDNFVSLPEIQPWLQRLHDVIDEKAGQAMVISHHPEVIDYLGIKSAWRLERDTGPVRTSRLEMDASSGLRPSEILVRGG